MNLRMFRKEIKTKEPFEGLFSVENHILQAVVKDMKANGYDHNYPITIWKGKNICIDGHTRLMAAEVVKIETVPVFVRDFSSEDEAIQHTIHSQRDRRNMTDADIQRCVEAVDKLKQAGRPSSGELASLDANLGKSAEETAKIVGTSTRKVEKGRTVLKHADDETKAAVDAGTKSIHKAYTETQKRRKEEKEKSEPQPEYIHTETYEVSDAMEFVKMAIANLRRMQKDDPKRQEAFDYIIDWIGKTRHAIDYKIPFQESFEILERSHKSLFDGTVKFQMNCRNKKRLWKKYLPKIHGWAGNMHGFTSMWIEALRPEKRKPKRDLFPKHDPKETLEDKEFKEAYELFFREVLNAREMKWKTTSKEMAIKRINALKTAV